MTDKLQDSDQIERSDTLPVETSLEKGDKLSSENAQKLQALLDTLAQKVEEVDARSKALQGEKDRGVAKANKEVEELKRKLAEIEKFRKAGYDDETAIEELSFRDTVRQLKDQLGNVNPAPAGNGAVDVAKVINEAELDMQDPEVIAAFQNRQFTSLMEAENVALKLANRKARKPQPSDADKVSAPTATPSGGKSSAELLAAFESAKKYPLSQEYKAIKAELDKRGWQ